MAQVQLMKLVGGLQTLHDQVSDSARFLSLGLGQAAPSTGISSVGVINTGEVVNPPTTIVGSRALLVGESIIAVGAGWLGPGTLTLPAAPATGRVIEVYDDAGVLGAIPALTIDGNGKSIVYVGFSAGTLVMSTALSAFRFRYTGTVWFAGVL